MLWNSYILPQFLLITYYTTDPQGQAEEWYGWPDGVALRLITVHTP